MTKTGIGYRDLVDSPWQTIEALESFYIAKQQINKKYIRRLAGMIRDPKKNYEPGLLIEVIKAITDL